MRRNLFPILQRFTCAAMCAVTLALAAPHACFAGKAETSAHAAVRQVKLHELLDIIAASHGKVVLVNFFAAFCGPCRQEIPELKRMRKEIPEKDLVILGVAIDEKKSEAERIINSLGIRDAYPAYYGGDEIARAYRIDAIPFNVIYNRDGHIEVSEAGYVPNAELKQFIMTLIRR